MEKCGRPKKTSVKEDKPLIEAIQNESGMTINEVIEEVNLEISKTTGWKRFIDHSLEYKVMAVKWFMAEKHKKDRLCWAKEHIKDDKKFEQKVIFTDEALGQFNTRDKDV